MGKNIIKAGFLAVLILSAGAVQAADKMKKGLESAVFAGGCFWCVEKDFDHVKGVVETTSGYTGGILLNPTYKQLVEVFWRTVDPTDGGGQFCDRGQSYAPAIFANSPEQQKIAEMSLATLKKSGALKRPVKTPILKAAKFYPAEGYHQNYYKKNPIRYNFYRKSCGRNARVKEVWGDQAYQGVEKH